MCISTFYGEKSLGQTLTCEYEEGHSGDHKGVTVGYVGKIVRWKNELEGAEKKEN